MSRKQLTPNLVAEIHARSRAGLSARAIAKENGVSRQTVDRALAESIAPTVAGPVAQAAQSSSLTDGATSTSNAPATLDEFRTLMAELAGGLSDQARAARGKGDAAAYTALASKAASVLAMAAKLSPEAPEAEREGVFVTHDDMAKAAAAARSKILERVARRAAGGT